MSQEIKICSDASGCFVGGLSATDTLYSQKNIIADGKVCIGNSKLVINGTTVSSCAAELNLLDGFSSIPGACCTGTGVGNIACITTSAGLDGSGSSGTVNISLDLSELTDKTDAINTSEDEVIMLDNGAERRKAFSEIFGCNAYSSTAFTTCLGTTTASNSQTFTNKGGNISQWTNDSGFTTCTGDVTGITAGTLIDVDNGGTATPTVNVDLSELTDMTATMTTSDEFVVLDSSAQRRKAACEISNAIFSNGAGFTTCTGTTTPSNSQTFTNKGGNISQWTNDSGYTTCTGTGVGNIACITTSAGLDGSGSSGTVNISLDLNELSTSTTNGDGDFFVVVDASGCQRKLTKGNINNSEFNNNAGYTTCTGDITGVTAGTGMTGGGSSGSVTVNVIGGDGITANSNDIEVDNTVVRTCGSQTIAGDKSFSNDVTVAGDLTVTGDITCKDTIVSITSALSVTNTGTGPALTVTQDGTQPIAKFIDKNGDDIIFADDGKLCIAQCKLVINGTTVTRTGAQINAATSCTGTTTASNSQTFTNKGGNISQWTNNSGYTTCTGTGNIACITTSTGLDGSGSSGTVNISLDLTEVTLGAGLDSSATGLSLDLSELTDMTASINTSQDEVILLDNGAERRKLFCEIFGCNAYSSTAFTTCLGTTTASNSQTFTNKGGNISQWTNNSGYTTCTGTTTADNSQTFTNKGGNISQWTNDSGYTTCTGTGVGNITCVTTSTGLDGGASSGTATISLDLSELTDMTGSICTSQDEVILLDNGAERRKLFCEIFGCNAYNSTTIPSNNNQLTNGAGYTTCTGTTTASNSQTFTNKGGNISQWTNDSGYTTCTGDITGVTAGTLLDGGGSSGGVTLNVDLSELSTSTTNGDGDFFVVVDASNNQRKLTKGCIAISEFNNNAGYTTCTGDITNVVAGTMLDGGGNCGSVTLNVDLGEAPDMTESWATASDEFIVLDSGVQKRKLSCEIFGSNAFNSTTIPSNNNQLSNGCGYTTCTGTTTASNSQTFTNKGGNISQWTNDSGYTTCTGDITNVSAGTGISGGGSSGSVTLTLDMSELTDMTAAMVSTDEFIVLDNGADRRKAACEISNAIFSNGAGFTTCTGTTTASNSQTFTNKGGNISQWTNNSGYTTCTGTTTASNSQTFTNKGGNISQWTNDSGYTTCTGTGVGNITCVSTSAGLDGAGSSGTVTISLDLSELTDMTAGINTSQDEVILLDNGAERRKLFCEIFGCNAYSNTAFTTCTGTTTASNSQTFTNKGGNISQWTNNSGYTTCTGTTTPSNCQTFTNKSGNISQWTNNSGYTTCTGTTTASNSQTFTNKGGNISQWTNDSGYTTCTGDITGVTAGTLLDGGGSSGSVTLNVDLSELTDMTAGWSNTADEFVVLDNGAQRRKLSCEIFGSNAFNSTTIPTNNNQLTNGSGYTTCTGTTTASNSQTFTNKGGNISQWTNDSGYTTCTGDITNVSVGTGLDGGGASGSVTISLDLTEVTMGTGLDSTATGLSLDLSEFTDKTDAIDTSADEIIMLDNGAERRKAFCEIFGSNAYNSTTIPTNNNQLTNGAGYTTCTGTTTSSNSQTFTNKGGNISQWTNNSGYTTCTGNVVTSGSTFTGSITLNDSVCAKFGNSADLSIFHNGTSSFIDNDKNHICIRNNVDGDDGGNIYLMPHDNENGIIINDDSTVVLYNDNSVKFCTCSSGSRTTGTHCATTCLRSPAVCGTTSVCGAKACFSCAGIGASASCSACLTIGGSSGCGCCAGTPSILACAGVNICGTLSKSSGCFDIVHPLPALSATKRLSHSFVESPQADNIYSGVVQLTDGKATVNIDEIHGMTGGTLTALNRCFRTFTTNETNWDPVRGSISGNTLTVESCVADSTATVSWMVLGERQDPHMYENPFTDNDGRARVEYDA